MRKFTLRFEKDGVGEAEAIEFVGEDPHYTFTILERMDVRRRATLWEGEMRLGSVTREGDLWQLG